MTLRISLTMQNNGFGNDERLRHWQKAGVFFLFAKYDAGMQFYKKVSDIYSVSVYSTQKQKECRQCFLG